MSPSQISHSKATDKKHLKESLPEEQFVNPTVINVDTGEDRILPSPTLIGRLLSKDEIHFSILETTINQCWNLLDSAEVFPLDDNIYLISFQSEKDLDRAWSQRPWDILGCHLLLQHAQDNVTANEYNLDFTSFWIQMHGLPFDLMVKDVAVKIGSSYGEVEEFDTVKRKFVRMRIKWNTKRPITPGFLLPRQNMGPAWINFRFEKLSNFCFECGSLFHTIGGCSVNNSVKTENIDEVNLRKLGDWVKAPAITCHPNNGLNRQTVLEPQFDRKSTKHEYRNDTTSTKDSGGHKVNLSGQHENENTARITRPLTLSEQRERTRRLKLKDIKGYFHLSINEAAKQMNICPTVMKKICRRGGLTRWPYRKIKSIQTKIMKCKESLKSVDVNARGQVQAEIHTLAEELAKISNPTTC